VNQGGQANVVDTIIAAVHQLSEDRHVPILVAIDGRSGTGKSTIAATLANRLDATILECDDFYAGGTDAEWAERTPAEKVARCIDWRRMQTEAIEPLLAGRNAVYHPFNFARGEGPAEHAVTVKPAPVILLDGIYSARPELSDLVDLAVLVDMPDDRLRRRRLIAREGESFMAAWHAIWDEAEAHYFSHVRPRESFDLFVTSD
jgi:uridine kinase